MAKDKNKDKTEGGRFIRSKADFDVIGTDRRKVINRYQTKVAPILAAEAYRGNAEYILCAAEAFHKMLERIKSRRLNETHSFYVESARREIEWLARFASAKAIDDYPYPRLDKKRLKELGGVARPCLEGKRFLEDHAQRSIRGSYGCHDLSVLSKLCSPFTRQGAHFGNVYFLDDCIEKARELLSGIPAGRNTPEYAAFIQQKTELETKVADALLLHFADEGYR